MTPNPILEELYRVRDEYAASFNNDLNAIVDDIRRQQDRDGGGVVSFPPRRPKHWKDKAEVSEAIAEFAATHGGSTLDLDPELEANSLIVSSETP